MTPTLLLIVAATIGVTAVCVVATRAYDLIAEPMLAGETTAVGLADPATETMGGQNEKHEAIQSGWQLTTVSDLSDAEELLDCLEYEGYSQRELLILGNSSFAVRWR